MNFRLKRETNKVEWMECFLFIKKFDIKYSTAKAIFWFCVVCLWSGCRNVIITDFYYLQMPLNSWHKCHAYTWNGFESLLNVTTWLDTKHLNFKYLKEKQINKQTFSFLFSFVQFLFSLIIFIQYFFIFIDLTTVKIVLQSLNVLWWHFKFSFSVVEC